MTSHSTENGSLAHSANANIAFCRALLLEFARAGAEHLCICPGSRSAPLAIASQHVTDLHSWVHVDERAAAFFALGLAKASGRAAVLFCTSGTAAANFYPAVIEAWYGRIPLIVLTADRPAELREWGGGQTIQQTHIYGHHIRWFAEAPLPEADNSILRMARGLGARAAAIAQGDIKGPVHLNLPFREPLTPQTDSSDREKLEKLSPAVDLGRDEGFAYTRRFYQCGKVPEKIIEELSQLVRKQPRGILLCGDNTAQSGFCGEIVRFSEIAAWPVIADPLSQLRFGTHIPIAGLISCGDLLLRSRRFRKHMAPGCIVHLGATLTGKAARLWALEHDQCLHLSVDGQQRWNDPDHLANEIFSYDPTQLFYQLNTALEDSGFTRLEMTWFDAWVKAENIAKKTLAGEFAQNRELLEPAVGASLAACLPHNCDLFLSSSMPIRDIDSFSPPSTKSIRVFSNRGANGIDGVISSALGVAGENSVKKNGRRTLLLIGDLAFLHDIGGLLAASRTPLDLTIIVINNDGGGIFSFLPISQYPEQAGFDRLFTSPHGLSLHAAAQLYGLDYEKIENLSQFLSSLKAISENSGTRVLELCVDRNKSIAFQKQLISRVSLNIEDASAWDLPGNG